MYYPQPLKNKTSVLKVIYLFRYFLLLSNNCVHNLVNLCKEILPKNKSDNTFLRPTDVLEESTPVSFVRIAKLCLACPAWGLKTVSSGGWRASLCVITQSSYSRKSSWMLDATASRGVPSGSICLKHVCEIWKLNCLVRKFSLFIKTYVAFFFLGVI